MKIPRQRNCDVRQGLILFWGLLFCLFFAALYDNKEEEGEEYILEEETQDIIFCYAFHTTSPAKYIFPFQVFIVEVWMFLLVQT